MYKADPEKADEEAGVESQTGANDDEEKARTDLK